MRETNFIRQNKEKWEDFEEILDQDQRDPEKLNDLFIQVTDDLSFSRTFYPNRSVRVYLNGLAQRIFLSIYQSRRSLGRSILSFWVDELPQLIYESRVAFRLSFFLFVLALSIGALSAAMDPEFLEIILGEDYVAITNQNIERGDPMAIYKAKGVGGMSIGITLNNLLVSFLTFVTGVFFMIGTVAMIIRNGIMVGAFQYFFIERDLFWESFLTIWIHGTLEMSALVIAGTAGLTMGRGLVFPGTYTRAQAFQRSARRGIKIMMGIVPIIIIAGFIEGYLTRHTEVPAIVRGIFILACLLFVIVYFVWYPVVKARIGFPNPVREAKIPPSANHKIEFSAIKSAGEIFRDIFLLYRQYWGRILFAGIIGATLFTALAYFLSSYPPSSLFVYPGELFGMFGVMGQFFVNEGIPLLPLVNILSFGVFGTLVNALFAKHNGQKKPSILEWFSRYGQALLAMGIIQLLFMTNDWYTVFLLLFLLPIPLLWMFIMQYEGLLPWRAVSRLFFLITQNYVRVLGVFIILFWVGLLGLFIMDTSLLWFFLDLVTWIVPVNQSSMDQLTVVMLTFINVLVFHLLFGLALLGIGLLYHTMIEVREAPALRAKIGFIGNQNKIRGLEKEA